VTDLLKIVRRNRLLDLIFAMTLYLLPPAAQQAAACKIQADHLPTWQPHPFSSAWPRIAR